MFDKRIECFTNEEVIRVFRELEDYRNTGVLGAETIARKIIEEECNPDYTYSFIAVSLSFQVEFYRMLATRHIKQKVL